MSRSVPSRRAVWTLWVVLLGWGILLFSGAPQPRFTYSQEPVPTPTPPPAPAEEIVFPNIKDIIPQPPPPPPPNPNVVPTIEYGKFYVIESDAQFFLLVSPKTFVPVSYEDGPIKLRGVFVDGTGKVETRTYKKKFIAIVEPLPEARGEAELIAIPKGVETEDKIKRLTVDLGPVPEPEPEPDPEPTPDPTPPGPVVPVGFRVIIVYEGMSGYSPQIMTTMFSEKVQNYLDSKCAKDSKGKPEWRRWDKDVEFNSEASPTLKELWTAAQPKIGTNVPTVPRVITTVNQKFKVQDLPATEEEFLTLLKKEGGQ